MSASDAAKQAADAELPSSDEVLPGLVDLSQVSLAELRFVDGSPIARAVARLIEEAKDPADAIAGFENSL
jgi:FXSXX-COOH protein